MLEYWTSLILAARCSWQAAVVSVPGVDDHTALPGSAAAHREMALALAGAPPTCESALDTVLDGGLQRQMASRSRGNTYRSEAVRLASPAGWMWLGFDVGLGPFADRPLGATQARTRTGASIVAVVRGEQVLPSPPPAQILQGGDVLVVIGTHDGIAGVEQIVRG